MKNPYDQIADDYVTAISHVPKAENHIYEKKIDFWIKARENWFKLSDTQLVKLKDLIKERDKALRITYQWYMGEDVPTSDWDAAEVHHVAHRGSGGDDKPNNLISLSFRRHRFSFHSDNVGTVKFWNERAKQYLDSPEVKAWEEANEDKLEAIYQSSETARIRKKRKNCIPKKPKWARF